MIDLTTILKNASEGTELYSPIFGTLTLVDLIEPKNEGDYAIKTKFGKSAIYFTKYGQYHKNGECMLFPSAENRSWEGVSFKPKREDLPKNTPVVTFTKAPRVPSELVILYYDNNGKCFVDEDKNLSIPLEHIVPIDMFDFETLSWNLDYDYGASFDTTDNSNFFNILEDLTKNMKF